ncbi:MAG: MATE family efflux transporter, partial [Gammaproteobacteria bacterium]|nr:MATE family efflux transporter [Gammaproteobacteria bacterium]
FIYAHTIFFGAILKPYALFDRKALLDLAILKTIAKKGIPLGVDYSANLAAFMTITYFCGIRGTAGLVAIQVASLYAGTIKAAAGTLFTASNSLVGKHALNTGSRNAVTIGNAGIFLSTGVAVAGLMVVLFSPEFIARILISESEPSEHNNFEMAIKLLRIEGVLQIGTAIRVSITAYLSGIQDNFFPMMVTIICNLLINVTSAAVAKFALDKDESVIYGSQAVGFTIAAIMMLSRLMQKSSAYQYNDAVMPAAPIANHSSRCVNPYHFLRSCFSKNNTAPGEKTRLIRSDSVDSVASLATLNP